MSDEKPSLGYIGLGLMGAPMALRLAEAGYPLSIWGRSPAKLEAAKAAGATVMETAAHVAREADIVFTCLSDTEAVEAVVFGENGLAAGAAPGKLLVDMSSIRPEAARDMAARLREETGMGWIDAPVSGGVVGSETGKLTIMAGGAEADFARAEPVVAHLAQRFTLMGPNGAGQATKLINQIFVGCSLAVLSEAAALAMRAGIDAARIPEALEGGRADSLPLQQFFPKMVSGDFFVEAHIRTMLKDLDTVLALARETTTAMPMTATALELHRLMVQRGHGDEDGTALATLYLDHPV
ncbi:MAG: NAD(P)-dependent oxidoreductase [Alphaproteobacteria bacterium]|nr:NAD(P)-dependent oxidoreductase [Alphaproteobacteria bacterium]